MTTLHVTLRCRYTKGDALTVPNMDDAMEWRQLLKSLEILSFTEAERDGFSRYQPRAHDLGLPLRR